MGRASAAAAMLAVATLPIHGVGRYHIAAWTGVVPFDALVGVSLLLALPGLARDRDAWVMLRAPALWMACLLALAGLVSEAARPAGQLPMRMAEQAAPAVAALVLCLHARTPAGHRRLLWAAFVGGCVALVVGLVGWLVDVALGTTLLSFRSPHPIFAGLPRLSGTFAGSPQRCGSYLLLWLTVVAGLCERGGLRRWRLSAVAGGLSLALTMTWAWVGACFVAAGLSRWGSGRARALLVACGVGVALVASVPMSVGPASGEVTGDCQALDMQHYAVVHRDGRTCTRLALAGRALTQYTEAKRASLAAFAAHPIRGTGYRGFEDFSRRAFKARHGGEGVHYTQPHGIYHGLPAKHGLFGVFALLALLSVFARGFRGTALCWGIVAFLVVGLHIDIDRYRELWALLGLLAGTQCHITRQAAPRP